MTSEIEVSRRLKARAKHDLQNKNPAPASVLRYYREQADNTMLKAADRRLWRQLADELEEHLESKRPLSVEELEEAIEPLF